MSDRKLELNGLARYRKSSPRLVLEEHGGCEIPAGCGGVILRWYDPAAEVAASVWIVTAEGADAFLDGRPLHNGRPTLAAGLHVISLVVPRPGPLGFVLALVLASGASDVRASRDVPRILNVVTVAGPSWRYATSMPGAGWREPGFADSGWSPMIARPGPREGEGTIVPYAIRYVHAHGGEEIGVPCDGPLWVRHELMVETGR